jgi:hypothetical protein
MDEKANKWRFGLTYLVVALLGLFFIHDLLSGTRGVATIPYSAARSGPGGGDDGVRLACRGSEAQGFATAHSARTFRYAARENVRRAR